MQELRETQIWSLGWDDPLEKEMVTHCSILAWRIPKTEKPSRLQSKHQEEGNGNPLQYSCLEHPMDRGSWRAAIHRVTRVRHNWICTRAPFRSVLQVLIHLILTATLLYEGYCCCCILFFSHYSKKENKAQDRKVKQLAQSCTAFEVTLWQRFVCLMSGFGLVFNHWTCV